MAVLTVLATALKHKFATIIYVVSFYLKLKLVHYKAAKEMSVNW
jgi:hypothetical protein